MIVFFLYGINGFKIGKLSRSNLLMNLMAGGPQEEATYVEGYEEGNSTVYHKCIFELLIY